jgi:hypothetical protein
LKPNPILVTFFSFEIGRWDKELWAKVLSLRRGP